MKHHHIHLDIFINGQPITIPANIGLASVPATFGSPIHTHADDGILHVEPDEHPTDLTLGNFFDLWQVRLTEACIGGYCVDESHPLQVYINGFAITGNPRNIYLNNHDQITIVYGMLPEAGIPSSYNFPPGY